MWFDVHRLAPGDDWGEQIDHALRASDALLVVASREALDSAHVQAEVALADELGIRMVVALVEDVTLTGVLLDAPCVDPRRRFERKLDDLSTALKDADAVVSPYRVPRLVGARASSVRTVSALLLGSALLLAACAILRLRFPGDSAVQSTFDITNSAVLAAACLWLWWAFSHRRRGVLMQLAFAFGVMCFTGAILTALAVYVLLAAQGPIDPVGVGIVIVFVLVTDAPIAVGVVALRSPSFVRWLPTGDAPRWMRRRMLARRGQRDAVQPPAEPITYELYCHDLDRFGQPSARAGAAIPRPHALGRWRGAAPDRGAQQPHAAQLAG